MWIFEVRILFPLHCLSHSLHMNCECFVAISCDDDDTLDGPITTHWSVNDCTSNRKLKLLKRNNPATHFLKVRFTCKLYSGKERRIFAKEDLKKRLIFYTKGMKVPNNDHFFLIMLFAAQNSIFIWSAARVLQMNEINYHSSTSAQTNTWCNYFIYTFLLDECGENGVSTNIHMYIFGQLCSDPVCQS